MGKQTIRRIFRDSAFVYSQNKALSFVNSEPIIYRDLYNKVVSLALKLQSLGIQKGDKVAVLSSNCPNWAISYLSVVFTGAVVVPILNDFSKKEIENILEHSDAKAIFVSSGLKSKIANIKNSLLQYVIDIESFNVADIKTGAALEIDLQQIPAIDNQEVTFGALDDADLAAIIYTSGTTGSSKGVMLSHLNIVSNIYATFQIQKIKATDRLLSVLPMSHSYECTLGFLMPLFNGACVYYLSGPPTASILIPALQKVKPTLMLSVPLIIEKIYKSKVLPAFSSGFAKQLYSFVPTRKFLNYLAGIKLKKTFGGHLHFFGIGGAMLNAETEQFLREARFPFAIGYGLTETSPLLAAYPPGRIKARSTGYSLPGQQLRLDNVSMDSLEGEIVVKGANVMLGYYKEEELTRKCFTSDGWFRTGDLGYFDAHGRLFIKGRLKNMILGANGENIYPEEIEAVLHRHSLVQDAIVYELKGKLVAKVHLDYNELEAKFEHFKVSAKHLQTDMQQHVHKTLEDIRFYVNAEVSGFSKLALVIEQPVPFEKTPTFKIKKYLYV